MEVLQHQLLLIHVALGFLFLVCRSPYRRDKWLKCLKSTQQILTDLRDNFHRLEIPVVEGLRVAPAFYLPYIKQQELLPMLRSAKS